SRRKRLSRRWLAPSNDECLAIARVRALVASGPSRGHGLGRPPSRDLARAQVVHSASDGVVRRRQRDEAASGSRGVELRLVARRVGHTRGAFWTSVRGGSPCPRRRVWFLGPR